MADGIAENVKRELWFWYFADYLCKHGTITAEKRTELERVIMGVRHE